MEFEPTKEDLQQLRQWIQKTPYILQNYEDQFLAALIRVAKNSLQKTKVILENCNALGMKYRDFFGSLDPLNPRLQETLLVWLVFPLPEKTPEGCTVIFTSLNSKFNDPSKSHIPEFYKYVLLTVYILLWENNFGSGQVIFIFDNKGINFAHLKDVTPALVKQIITIAESAIPVRIKSACTYNIPPFAERVFNLFKMFAKNKLADRINFYSSNDMNVVPREMLPKEYGGSEESVFVLHDNWKKKVESYRERFLEEERMMRELDHLRPVIAEDDYMNGTFRQLAVD